MGFLSASGFAGCKDGQDSGCRRNGERRGVMDRAPTRNTSRCAGEQPPYGPPAVRGDGNPYSALVHGGVWSPALRGDRRNMLRPYGLTCTYPSQSPPRSKLHEEGAYYRHLGIASRVAVLLQGVGVQLDAEAGAVRQGVHAVHDFRTV